MESTGPDDETLADFAAQMSSPEPSLDHSVALIASMCGNGVDTAQLLLRLDLLAERQRGDTVESCAQMFGPGGLRGDVTNYYDPRNSLLDQVLDRRRGIPISLCIVAMEVGRRRGAPLVGVGMPGHFLARSADDDELFVDPFHGGAALDRGGCRALFDRLHRGSLVWDPAYLDPTPPSMIVERVLNNLQGAYTRRGDRSGLIDVLRLRVALPGSGRSQRLELASLQSATGRFLDAARVFDELAALEPLRAGEHRRAAQQLRARLN